MLSLSPRCPIRRKSSQGFFFCWNHAGVRGLGMVRAEGLAAKWAMGRGAAGNGGLSLLARVGWIDKPCVPVTFARSHVVSHGTGVVTVHNCFRKPGMWRCERVRKCLGLMQRHRGASGRMRGHAAKHRHVGRRPGACWEMQVHPASCRGMPGHPGAHWAMRGHAGLCGAMRRYMGIYRAFAAPILYI